MKNFRQEDYKVFEMFDKQWALVTAGGMDHFNSCTIGWGSLGNIWAADRKTISTVTVYVHPARYTSEFLKESDTFTVSFYPDQYRKALGYMGSHSGRDGDKAAAAGLTPVAIGDGVTYEEANLTFLCKKTVSASVCQRRSRTGNPGILRFHAESLPGFQRRLAATHRVCGTDSRRGRQTIKGGEPWDFNSGQLQFCSYFMDAIWEKWRPRDARESRRIIWEKEKQGRPKRLS